MPRFKNMDWDIAGSGTGSRVQVDIEGAILAVLMDLREEIQRLNMLLHCPNFMVIPGKLERIARKLPSRRKRGRHWGSRGN